MRHGNFRLLSRDWCGTCFQLACPAPSPDPDVPYLPTHTVFSNSSSGYLRWPVHTTASQPEQDNRNIHQTRSHGIDILSLAPRYPSPRVAFVSPHLTLKPHSCLIPRHLKKVSLSPHPLHHLLCRKALWHRSAHPIIFLMPPIDLFKRRDSLHSVCPSLTRCL